MLREGRRDFRCGRTDRIMCQYCLHTPCLPGCPNYEEPKAVYHCSICKQGIFEGEEYIENGGDYVHFECIPDLKWLLEWLGFDIKEMKDFEYYKE